MSARAPGGRELEAGPVLAAREECAVRQAPSWLAIGRRMEARSHRAVLADTLAALDRLLVGAQRRLLAVKRAQLDVHAQGVIEEAAGAILGLAAAPIHALSRLAVGVELTELVCGSRARRGLSEQRGSNAWHARACVDGSVSCRGHCCARALTPAAGQAAAVDASAVDVRLVGVPDVVVAGGPKGAHSAQALVALAVLVGLAGLRGVGSRRREV